MIILFLQILFIYGMDIDFLNVKQNECPICYERLQKNTSVLLLCNHALCKKCCFDCFIAGIEKCPICRRLELKNDIFHYFSDSFIKNMLQEKNYSTATLYQMLHKFAALERLELCEYLVQEYKIDVNFQREEDSGDTLLHCILDSYDISLENEFEIFRFFVEKFKADMTITNFHGENLLHYAAGIANVEITQYILENTNFSIDETDNENSTPLIHLLFCNTRPEDVKLSMVQFLFEHYNPNIFIQNEHGHTPIFLALRQGSFHIFEYFVRKVEKAKHYFEKHFYLHKIISGLEVSEDSKLKAVKFLLENYNVSTEILKDGRSVLHEATQAGHLKLLEYLIPFCDINVRTEEHGLTPLSLAVVSNKILDEDRINLVSFLIKKGANINAKNKDGNTPLALSIMFRNEELIKFFVDDKTVYVNTINEKEVPTLMLLVINDFENEKRVEIFKYFLDHRKEINLNEIKIYTGGNLIHLAAHFGFLELINFFDQNTCLNLNDVDDFRNTVLHYVIMSSEIQEKQKVEILEYFRVQLDLTEYYTDDTTLLHECIFFGFFDVALYLLQTTCINLNIHDKTGHTPIHTLLASDQFN